MSTGVFASSMYYEIKDNCLKTDGTGGPRCFCCQGGTEEEISFEELKENLGYSGVEITQEYKEFPNDAIITGYYEYSYNFDGSSLTKAECHSSAELLAQIQTY